jgi:hypothetical protein
MPPSIRQPALPERCPLCNEPVGAWVFVRCLHLCSACYHELAEDHEPVNLVPERIDLATAHTSL